MRVLVVENDVKASARLNAYLLSEGIRVEVTDAGEKAFELLRHYEFDVVILSLSLPDMDGSSAIRRMRRTGKYIPVLALASSASPEPKVRALAAGADDAVVQSIEPMELLARLRAIVRRSGGYSPPMLQVGSVTLDLEGHEVSVAGSRVPLTGKEFAVLQLLMMRKNMILTKETILSQIYGGMDEPELKIIDVFVCKLRKKLAVAGAPEVIGTVWGRGYTIRDINRDSYTQVAPTPPAPTERLLPISIVPA